MKLASLLRILVLFTSFILIGLAKVGWAQGPYGAATSAFSQQQKTAQNIDHPLKGMTKNQVYNRYGAALVESLKVGSPPVSYWEYRDFTVYFEYNSVIHTVLHPANNP